MIIKEATLKDVPIIVKMFEELHRSGKTIVIITHDMSIAEKAERIIKLKDGLVQSNGHLT